MLGETVAILLSLCENHRLSARFGLQYFRQQIKNAVNPVHFPNPFAGPGRVGPSLEKVFWIFIADNLKQQFPAGVGIVISANKFLCSIGYRRRRGFNSRQPENILAVLAVVGIRRATEFSVRLNQ